MDTPLDRKKKRTPLPPEVLERYAGRYVAWSPDGMRVLADDPDPCRVIEAVQNLGRGPKEAVIRYIPPPDEARCTDATGGAP